MRLVSNLVKVLLSSLRWLIAGPVWIGTKAYEGLDWLCHFRVELWRVEGEEQHSHLPLSILCSLRGKTKDYCLKLIFGDCYRQRSLGRYWLWNLTNAMPDIDANCSMLLTWTCASQMKYARATDWFLVPELILGKVSLPRDATATHKVKRDLRKIRMRGLSYEVTHDSQAFEDFYHNMYYPYATKMFGNCAYMTPYKYLKKIFRSSDLLLINKDGRSIAGQFIIYNQPGPCLLVMGIRDANRAHIKDGAGDAVYHFGLQYLEQKGFTGALVGWTSPFLHDGVLKFKRKWSQVITGSRSWGFGLKVLADKPATRSFLRNNPFIFRRDGLLYAAVFVDTNKPLLPEDIQQMTKDYFCAGLSGMEIYCLPTQDAPVAKPLAAHLPEHVDLRVWPQ